MHDSIEFMRSLDERYRQAANLTDRRYYSIFYSPVVQSPALVIGFNPGGDPEIWDKTALASDAFYESGEHEYVDSDYRIAVAMRDFLTKVFDLDDVSRIRALPKTNLIFRR